MRIDTNEIKLQITKMLEGKCKNVFFETAETEIFPYVVYEIEQSQEEEGKISCTLEVNCIDKGTSVNVEKLADEIQEMFSEFRFENEKISFYTYKDKRQTIQEEDKKIRRRRLLFELNWYSKEEIKE